MINILLEEYKALKSEQLERIKHRDNIIFIMLGAMGTLFSFSIIHQAYYVVAILPILSLSLCWIYLANDSRISEIGTYIEEDLASQIQKHLKTDEEIFYWEKKHREYKGRKTRKMIQYVVDLLIFAVPTLFSLVLVKSQGNSYIFVINLVFSIVIFILFIMHYSRGDITKETE